MAEAQRPARLGRLLIGGLVLAYMAVALGNGLDRHSALNPDYERLVAGPFRDNANKAAAQKALMDGRADAAVKLAVKALETGPIDTHRAGLLGATMLARGEGAPVEAAFRQAAALGWRDGLTQIYWYEAALQAGDYDAAALRADAVLRLDNTFVRGMLMLEPLEANEGGRKALAKRLAEGPRWAGRFASPSVDLSDAAFRNRAAIFLLVPDYGKMTGCDVIRPMARASLDRGMRGLARDLWSANCERLVDDAGLSDLRFSAIGGLQSASPFGWREHRSGDIRMQREALDGTGPRLTVRSAASTTRLILSQAANLPAGDYVFRLSPAVEGAAGSRLVFSYDCGSKPSMPAHVDGDPASGGQRLSIGECNRQQIGLWLRPGREPVQMDELVVERR